MKFFYKTMLFRILIFSCCLLVVGVIMMIDGIKNIVIYNSDPKNINAIQNNELNYSHIRFDQYQVIDAFYDDMDDSVFFLIEIDDCYYFVESHKGSQSYNELSVLLGKGMGTHDYVINGYLYKNNQKCISFLQSELGKRGYMTNQMLSVTKHSIILLGQDLSLDRVKVGFGCFTIVFCGLTFIYAFSKKKMYYSTSKFWFS